MPKAPNDDFDISNFDADLGSFGEGGEEQDFFEAKPPPPPPGRGPLPQQPPQPPPVRAPSSVDKKVVNLTSDIPVQIVAVLGKKSVTVKDVVSMRMGQVVELNRLPNEAIDLVANGKLIAKGELVEIDGRLGVRILKIFD